MRRGEALSLADTIGSYWALVNDGIRTFDDADGVIDDLADAIGREAEEGGWYSEWDEALSRARPSRPDGMTFGEEMHALANPQCKVNTIAEALPFYMEIIEHHAKKGWGQRVIRDLGRFQGRRAGRGDAQAQTHSCRGAGKAAGKPGACRRRKTGRSNRHLRRNRELVGGIDMGFYVSHSDLLLLIDKGISAEKKQAIREVVGDDADGFDETELPGGLTALTPIPENRWDEFWPEGRRQWGFADEAKAVLELCEDGSFVEWFNCDEFCFERLDREGGEIAYRSSDPYPSWRL